jgi:hypothetical protein
MAKNNISYSNGDAANSAIEYNGVYCENKFSILKENLSDMCQKVKKSKTEEAALSKDLIEISELAESLSANERADPYHTLISACDQFNNFLQAKEYSVFRKEHFVEEIDNISFAFKGLAKVVQKKEYDTCLKSLEESKNEF